MKIIQGNRSVLEQRVLKTLISPISTSKDLDEAVERLKPAGTLRLISSEPQPTSIPFRLFSPDPPVKN